MSVVVSILGVLAAMIGLMGLANPKTIVGLVEYWRGPTRYYVAVGVRMVLGVIFLVVAPSCRLPILVQVLGVISIVAAIVILIAGQERLDSFISWWLKRPPGVIRVSALFAFAFGILLVYAGA